MIISCLTYSFLLFVYCVVMVVIFKRYCFRLMVNAEYQDEVP